MFAELCAWNNHYCWPGTCGDGIVKNCQCASGFQRTSTPTETSCQRMLQTYSHKGMYMYIRNASFYLTYKHQRSNWIDNISELIYVTLSDCCSPKTSNSHENEYMTFNSLRIE